MATAIQKRAQRAAKSAADKVKADGGDQAAQDAAAEAAKAEVLAGGDQGGDQGDDGGAGAGDAGAGAGAGAVDPDVAAAAAAAGLDPKDLDAADIADIKRAAELDRARTGAATTAKPGARVLVREANGRTDSYAITLMREACEKYGVSPYADQRPQELLAWRFYQGSDDPSRGVMPDAVVIVTAGGLKVKHFDDPDYPMDPETVDRLRRVFSLFVQDPKTKEVKILDLPADLTLPAAAVTGQVMSTEHQYQGGYLKAGGADAAAKKQARRDERAKRLGTA